MSVEVKELRDVSVELDEWEVWSCLGGRDRIVPALADEVAQAVAEGRELWSPRGLPARLAVREIGRSSITFDSGPSLEGKFLSHLFTGAQEADFLVVTIGPDLESRVAELFTEGKSIEAFVLDAVGSAAVMNLFTQILATILEDNGARGSDTGTCLRPGQAYWDITGQSTIFQMVPAERIGVQLLESSFMTPLKSQSGIVPLGPDLRVHGDPNESYCRYCQATRCPMRREPQADLRGDPTRRTSG